MCLTCIRRNTPGGEKGYSDHISLTFTMRKGNNAHQSKQVCKPVFLESWTGAHEAHSLDPPFKAGVGHDHFPE